MRPWETEKLPFFFFFLIGLDGRISLDEPWRISRQQTASDLTHLLALFIVVQSNTLTSVIFQVVTGRNLKGEEGKKNKTRDLPPRPTHYKKERNNHVKTLENI